MNEPYLATRLLEMEDVLRAAMLEMDGVRLELTRAEQKLHEALERVREQLASVNLELQLGLDPDFTEEETWTT